MPKQKPFNTTPIKSPPKPRVNLKQRTEQIWQELEDEDKTSRDFNLADKLVKNAPWWKKLITRGLWLAILLIIGLAILNFGYLSVWIEHTVFAPNTYTSQTTTDAPAEKVVGTPNEIFIPSLEIRAPILYAQSKTEKEFQELLAKGVVHYPGTANPGEMGNVYIFGHSSDYVWSKGKFKTVFALLPSIEIGSEVLVSNQNGEVFSYTVREKFVAEKTDMSLLSQDTQGKKILTLQTSYPLGTALRRYIVKGELSP